ncbi:MAG: hypothetical protein ACRCX2_36325 [Paraclostridium sp.]
MSKNKNLLHYIIGRILKRNVGYIMEFSTHNRSIEECETDDYYYTVIDFPVYDSVYRIDNDELVVSLDMSYYDDTLDVRFSDNKISISNDSCLVYNRIIKEIKTKLKLVKLVSSNVRLNIYEIDENKMKIVHKYTYDVIEISKKGIILLDTEYDTEEELKFESIRRC